MELIEDLALLSPIPVSTFVEEPEVQQECHSEPDTNIKVFCRFRPIPNSPAKSKYGLKLDTPDNAVHVSCSSKRSSLTPGLQVQRFTYDGVFAPETTQCEVYNACARPLLKEALRGYNCTILAYGQTSSGKSHTIMGDIDSNKYQGIIPRIAHDLFDEIETSGDADEYTITVSFVEIYMERIRDLLARKSQNYTLRLRQGKRSGAVVEDATEEFVCCPDEIMDLARKGICNRAVASTAMNPVSSRSHSVFTITVSQVSSGKNKKTGKVVIVDLAGSEMLKKTKATSGTLEEAKQINKSLSALGNVIKALTESAKFVPFRDSKLTRILENSLGGNSLTSLIITCGGGTSETLSTLRFGSRAKRIKNTPVVNEDGDVCKNPNCQRLACELLELKNNSKCKNEKDKFQETRRALSLAINRNEKLSCDLDTKVQDLEELRIQYDNLLHWKESFLAAQDREEDMPLSINTMILESKTEEIKSPREQALEGDLVKLTDKYIQAKVLLENAGYMGSESLEKMSQFEQHNQLLLSRIQCLQDEQAAFQKREESYKVKIENRNCHIYFLESALRDFQEMYKETAEDYKEQLESMQKRLSLTNGDKRDEWLESKSSPQNIVNISRSRAFSG